MSVDDIVVEIHHRGKFVDGDKVEYIRGGVSEIEPIDIDRLSRFEIIGLAKDIGFTNMEEFCYLIRGMSLREGLKTCHNDFESLDMAAVTAVNKRLVAYLVHMVDVPKEVVPEMPTLPCPFMTTQQSNVDPMSSSFNNGQECDQKGKKKQKVHKKGPIEEPVQQDQTPTPTPTPTPAPAPTPTPTLTSTAAPIPSPTSTTQKAHSHDTTPNFNVNNEHVPEWDWEDPKPKSPIPWDKLIEGESLNEGSDDSEYVPETEVDLEVFEDIAGSISKARGKRKINVGGGVDDDGCENEGDERDWDIDIEDEWEADVEDLETSDEEWAVARAKVGECKEQKGSEKINNTQQVGKQDMTADKSSTSGIEQTQLGSSFHSDYETSEAEMDTDRETDGDVRRLLRKKEKPIKVDEHTDFKKLKWQVGMTFGTVQGFKDVISSFSVSQGSKEQQLLEVEEEVEAGEVEGDKPHLDHSP
ncbi:hypothetical protein Cgig2_009672 [Carnegiea gigantea]|uniref:PB1-like domain-containing protein n=1 Tax=Carnegiea gigantea TaxID=171969 RepID=A0A9Q1JI24_9CARY|nr:hypothetical protein Cgig2_009672 [Carnegiea gigantea]